MDKTGGKKTKFIWGGKQSLGRNIWPQRGYRLSSLSRKYSYTLVASDWFLQEIQATSNDIKVQVPTYGRTWLRTVTLGPT